jgi:hypothetical protein
MTKRLITLMKEKNHFLEKYMSLNEREVVHFQTGKFDRLEMFYADRERILEIIKYLDGEIDREQKTLSPEQVNQDAKAEIAAQLEIKKEVVDQVLKQDLDILSLIEREKSSIIRELQNLRKDKKGISGYKSSIPTSRVNEEA